LVQLRDLGEAAVAEADLITDFTINNRIERGKKAKFEIGSSREVLEDMICIPTGSTVKRVLTGSENMIT